jgi:hypothetical protein
MLKSVSLLMSLLMAAAPAGAAVYRCSHAGGPVRYSDRPCGKGSVRIHMDSTHANTGHAAGEELKDTRATQSAPGPVPDVQVHIQNNINNTVPPVEKAPVPIKKTSRGMPFSTFRRLEEGMSEGQVLAVAGKPDRTTIDARNTRDGFIQKSWYYVSTGYNAFVTRIRFINGSVARLERTPIMSR